MKLSILKNRRVVVLYSIAVLVCFAWFGLRISFLRATQRALISGEISDSGPFGSFLSSKSGSLFFLDRIETRTFVTYVKRAKDPEARAYIIALLGWSSRQDALEFMQEQGEYPTPMVTLSKIAIERKILFPHEHFAKEFYNDYAQAATKLAHQKDISLAEAANEIAALLSVRYRTGK